MDLCAKGIARTHHRPSSAPKAVVQCECAQNADGMTWMIVLPLAVLALGLPLAHRAIRPRPSQQAQRQRVVLDHRVGLGYVKRGTHQ